jgi:hypothetical protein
MGLLGSVFRPVLYCMGLSLLIVFQYTILRIFSGGWQPHLPPKNSPPGRSGSDMDPRPIWALCGSNSDFSLSQASPPNRYPSDQGPRRDKKVQPHLPLNSTRAICASGRSPSELGPRKIGGTSTSPSPEYFWAPVGCQSDSGPRGSSPLLWLFSHVELRRASPLLWLFSHLEVRGTSPFPWLISQPEPQEKIFKFLQVPLY